MDPNYILVAGISLVIGLGIGALFRLNHYQAIYEMKKGKL